MFDPTYFPGDTREVERAFREPEWGDSERLRFLERYDEGEASGGWMTKGKK